MACTTAGCGEPVLLVHGLGGDRRTWDDLVEDLAADHTVIAPDLPGHGESDAPAGDYSLGAHATALRDLLAGLGHV
jgi:pimeloyl-ACP methyl ester carboxylesterase